MMATVSVGSASVNAHTAHHQWATRPEDERYQSVDALHAAAVTRESHSHEVRAATNSLAVSDVDDDLVLRVAHAAHATLTHWSFAQLAGLAGAPPAYLRTLPARIASAALNHGLTGRGGSDREVFITRRARGATAQAITSCRYARVHHAPLVARVLDLMASHPAWKLPLGYAHGVFSATLVPSGAYLGDRDLFLFLVDESRAIDDPTDRSGQGLFRGFILRNSDVGAAALTLDLFLYRMVCGNHLIGGFRQVASFRRRHVGHDLEDAWATSLPDILAALDADTHDDTEVIRLAQRQQLGSTLEDVVSSARAHVPDLAESDARAAYALAEQYESNPRSVWGFVQGLTRLSQQTRWQDARLALDRAAARCLEIVV